MTAIANRFAPTPAPLSLTQPPSTRAAAKAAATPAKPVDIAELTKARAATRDPMVDLNAAPILPSSGNAAPLPRDFGDQLEVYAAEMDGGAAALAWQSLMEMARSATIDIRTAADIRAIMQRGATEAKAAAIVKAERQQDHERAASLHALGTTLGVQLTACLIGGQLGTSLSNSAGAISNTMQQYVGPARKAQQEKLEQMHQELQQSIFEGNVESAKANYDEAKEQFKVAMRILSESAERRTQITNTITRV